MRLDPQVAAFAVLGTKRGAATSVQSDREEATGERLPAQETQLIGTGAQGIANVIVS